MNLISQSFSHSVIASREGRIGEVTATGEKLYPNTLGVALPSVKALHSKVQVTYGGQSVVTRVIDVGPWFEHDDVYVYGGERPAAERGTIPSGETNPGTQRIARNPAGIDLSDGLVSLLGAKPETWGLQEVTWQFV